MNEYEWFLAPVKLHFLPSSMHYHIFCTQMNKQKMNEVFLCKQRKIEQIYRANTQKNKKTF